MQSSDNYKVSSNLAVLLVGVPKSGKTCIAAAFPAPYFLEVDDNLDSAARVLAGKKFWYDVPTRNVKSPELVWKESLKCLMEAMANPEIKTIVVDSISLLSEFMCAWIISENVRMGKTDKNGTKIESMTIPDYGRLLTMFRTLIFDLRKSGKYVIVTSHFQTVQDELTKIIHTALAVPGQAKDSLGGLFTDVWGCYKTTIPGTGKVNFTMKTIPTDGYNAIGTSIRTMPASIDFTNKTPAEVWAALAPLIGGQV